MNYAEFVKPLYEPGDVVNSGRPYAFVLWSSARGRYCDHCASAVPASAETERVVCAHCETDCYCSADCRQAAWAYHRLECPLLDAWRRAGKSAAQLGDTTRMLFRALARRHFDARRRASTAAGATAEEDSFPSLDDPGWRRTFDDLLSHEDEIAAKPERYLSVLQNLDEFCQTAPERLSFPMPPRDQQIATFGRIRTNWCELYDSDLKFIGGAVYLSPSVVNHSCVPNSIFVTNGLRLDWRALRKIDTAAGEELSLDYVIENALCTTSERQALFREHYCFECGCSLCDGSEAAVRRDRRLASMRCVRGDDCRKEVACDYCEPQADATRPDERAAAEGEAKRVLAAMAESESRGEHALAAELASRYLSGDRRLGVCNVHVIRVREGLVRACCERTDGEGASESWQLGVTEGLVLLDVYRLLYYSPAWPVGKLQFNLGVMSMRCGQSKAAAKLFDGALAVLQVTHGPQHPLVRKAALHYETCLSAAGVAEP